MFFFKINASNSLKSRCRLSNRLSIRFFSNTLVRKQESTRIITFSKIFHLHNELNGSFWTSSPKFSFDQKKKHAQNVHLPQLRKKTRISDERDSQRLGEQRPGRERRRLGRARHDESTLEPHEPRD